MSVRFMQSLNSPVVVAATGTAVLTLFPLVQTAGLSLGLLKAANVAAFALNVTSVSVPGRIDGQQDEAMRSGKLNPSKPGEADPKREDATYNEIYSPSRGRTMVSPAGWAFAIWGPIYLGEAAFCAAQFSNILPIGAVLPQITAPFVAANILQSLWCASFRPSYNEGWKKYVSVGMLGGTALALSQVHAAVTPELAWYMLPMTMHFGWTTAATLVNLNGSVAMTEDFSNSFVIATGHASALLATALGVGVTLTQNSAAYGLTVAWALAACANGMKVRQEDSPLSTGMNVQRMLCSVGSAICVASAAVAAGFTIG